ncbi:DUF5666 domain-containing protein [Microvirga massiliensis]|uniref:DUF5666 domain-containing protein n=1 Tax=Microvirga massiliensis TaxID=1033741 RepID=UPI000B29FC51|nr:DUF5666 domain-containing protein [Microvirga massiliensis]
MRTRNWMDRLVKVAAVAAVLFACGPTAALAQAAQPVRVRGTVVSLNSSTLHVKSRAGNDASIRLAENWAVSGVVRAQLDDIKPGSFVGVAALPQAGDSLRAIEVLVFPENMRGTGEGHSPWDLLPQSSMTNATVASAVQGIDGRTLTLSYKGGEKTITVPPEAPIVTFGPAEKADVKAGAAVFVPVQRQADGTLQASRVLVGKDGVVPPM